MTKGERVITIKNLLDYLDIDEGISGGREVPINCVFVGENEIQKDTGIVDFANTGTGIVKSLYSWTKNDGTKILIRNLGTVLQRYNPNSGNFENFKTDLSNGKRFGYREYDGYLYMGNGYDNYMKWDGSNSPTEYASAPKGNILEVFEDRMFIAGNPSNPHTVYYSNSGDPTTFPDQNVIKPIGSDKITGLVAYYGCLIVFKEKSVWRIDFIWNETDFIPKLSCLSSNYGCISPKAYCWVENDVWFFTGKDVRRIGWLKGSGEGVLGFDPTSLSEQIKEALKKLNQSALSESACFYHNKRFYLAVPFNEDFNDLIFVCHTTYKKAWTKLAKREKAKANCFVLHDNDVYSASSEIEGRVYKWTNNYLDNNQAVEAIIPIREIKGDGNLFNNFQVYKFIDLEFKNYVSSIDLDIYFDYFDQRNRRKKNFLLTSNVALSTSVLGEIMVGQLWIGDGIGEDFLNVEYFRKRIPLLDKGQSIKIKLSNNRKENLILSQLGLAFRSYSSKYAQYI